MLTVHGGNNLRIDAMQSPSLHRRMGQCGGQKELTVIDKLVIDMNGTRMSITSGLT